MYNGVISYASVLAYNPFIIAPDDHGMLEPPV